MNIFRKIERWIAFRTYEKYHIVNTGLKPGYCDPVWRLPCAILTLNEEFVEKEIAQDWIDWDATSKHREAYATFISAYKFWKQFKDFEPYGDDKLDFIYRTKEFKKEYEESLTKNNGKEELKQYSDSDLKFTVTEMTYLYIVEAWYDEQIDKHCFNILKHRQDMWT